MTDPINELLGYALKQAQHALHRRMEDALRPLGLTPAQYAVLVALKAQPDQTNADLAEASFLTPQSMQSVIAKLEAAGLVERRPDEHHGRRQLARLTKAGETATLRGETCIGEIEAALEKAASPFSPGDALALLTRLRRAMQTS